MILSDDQSIKHKQTYLGIAIAYSTIPAYVIPMQQVTQSKFC